MARHYIVVMRNRALYLVGPFANREALRAWGGDEANNPADDPRWQSIELTDDQVASPLDVRSPSDGPMAP